MTLGFLLRLRELLQAPFGLLTRFCFTRIRLDPLGGQVLHDDSRSMIVSRFTAFTEDFVICCNQATNIFCPRNGCAGAFPARSPCHLGLQAYFAICTIWEVSKYGASWLPLSYDVRVLNLVPIPNFETCSRGLALLNLRDFL